MDFFHVDSVPAFVDSVADRNKALFLWWPSSYGLGLASALPALLRPWIIVFGDQKQAANN